MGRFSHKPVTTSSPAMTESKTMMILVDEIAPMIVTMREQKVMLDSDLAAL